MNRRAAVRVRRKSVAAGISREAMDLKSLALRTDPLLAIIEDGRAQIRAGKTLSLDEMKKAVLR